jgi:hypothetical protein
MGVDVLSRRDGVARKRGRPGKPSGVGRLVRLDPAIVAMAKVLATTEGIGVGDYLSGLLRSPVAREYAKVMKRLEQEGAE